MTSLRKRVDKARANALEEFKDSQLFFDLLGSQYSEGFKNFRRQAVLLFSSVDFSSVQIDTMIPMTSRWDDEVVDIKDGKDKEVSEGETLALRVTQGDGSMQLEGLMEDRTDLAYPFPLSPLNASCFFFLFFMQFSFQFKNKVGALFWQI